MLFNTWRFGIFFILVFLLYYLIPFKYRWVILLISSYYFYMCWKPEFIILIMVTTLLHYSAGIIMEKIPNKVNGGGRKLLLISSVTISLGILFFYKYFDFFSESMTAAFQWVSIPFDPIVLNLVLPMGISFYTFQTLSYTIDVYRGKIKAERHLGYFALYISFFPQLVAGPIERSDRLLPQLKAEHGFKSSNVYEGLQRMAVGFFKKLVVADTFAKGVNVVFNDVESYSGLVLAAATVMFAFQIYCDFSGYSDIAIGCAKTMGIDLMQNFNSPYCSRNIKEFWSRWHISLSTWFKDYVYIPLGGNRVGKWRTYFNLFLTFLLSGLWHGANWTFVIWGGLHGIYLIVERFISEIRGGNKAGNMQAVAPGKMKILLQIACTFTLVCFAWIFFRANSVGDAFYIIKNMFVGITNPVDYLKCAIGFLNISKLGILILAFELLVLVSMDILQLSGDLTKRISGLSTPVRWSVYVLFLIMTVVLSTKGTASQFIYFQF